MVYLYYNKNEKEVKKNMKLFIFDNIVVGILVLILGFLFHFVGQLICILNWEFAQKIGLQEEDLLPEQKFYEHGIAAADVAIGWIYPIVAIGLILDLSWAYQYALIPGIIFVYHGIFYWVMQGNHMKAGKPLETGPLRYIWFVFNLTTGLLAILIAI